MTSSDSIAETSAFTPGPWAQSHRKQPDGMWSTDVYDQKGETIATLAWHVVPIKGGIATDREANARLIAAAPDLYEALKSLIPILEAVRYTVGLRGNQLERMEAGRAALAKARGETTATT